jgi:biotin-dependent carboxylase-like uncharacterized protein
VSLRVIKAGLQTTVQAGPRTGLRHQGVPACGAADPLSMALANKLLGNRYFAPALEITSSEASFGFESAVDFAMTGATGHAKLNGEAVEFHETLSAVAGDMLEVNSFEAGARAYLALGGGILADEILGSPSTYLPAALGGFKGRALRRDDRLQIRPHESGGEKLRTPDTFRPPMSQSWAIRACPSAETCLLADRDSVFDENWVVGTRADRMGMALQGGPLSVNSDGRMPSAPVFPGTVQCPEDGQPFLLSVDAQTTGGYPRIAQVIRADRHMLGQLRPGDRVRLLQRDEQGAADDLRAKIGYWEAWLPGVSSVIC